MQGTVKWFSQAKRYGFIVPSDGSKDVFMHKSEIQGAGTLRDGDQVEFEVVDGAKGLEARNIRVIEVTE